MRLLRWNLANVVACLMLASVLEADAGWWRANGGWADLIDKRIDWISVAKANPLFLSECVAIVDLAEHKSKAVRIVWDGLAPLCDRTRRLQGADAFSRIRLIEARSILIHFRLDFGAYRNTDIPSGCLANVSDPHVPNPSPTAIGGCAYPVESYREVSAQLGAASSVDGELSKETKTQGAHRNDSGSAGENDAPPYWRKLIFGGGCTYDGGGCSLLLGEQIFGVVLIGLTLAGGLMGGVLFGLDHDYRKWRSRLLSLAAGSGLGLGLLVAWLAVNWPG